jgi:hypothetical protein
VESFDPDALTQPTPPAQAVPVAGTTIGGYRIERALAGGATAIVYRATDLRLGRTVALKVLQNSAHGEMRERFLREVRLVARLLHPNIVLLYGAGEDDGRAWAAMELLPGSLAQELQRQGRFSAANAAAAIRDACRGLEAAWQQGIVHRDIKPSNLLRDASGTVKVADFGLAKDLAAEIQLTAADVVLGTPLYVSPEQASGRPVGVASDLYSLGATLYHLLVGRPPFQSTSALDVIVRHAIEPPPALPDDIPAPLARLTMQLLEKDASRRPADYATVVAALEAFDSIGADDQALGALVPYEAEPSDGVAASLIAAARAANELGRLKRVRSLLEPLVNERGPGWVRAGFMLADALGAGGETAAAESILESIARDARIDDDRALALWSLGRLAERESAAALQRAVEHYRRVAGVSTSRFPKQLLQARIDRLTAETRRSEKDGR